MNISKIENLQKNQVVIKENYLNRQKKDIFTDSVFFSYESKIAYIKYGVLYFTSYWNYSTTTSKYLYQYLNNEINNILENKEEIKNALNSNNKKTSLQKLIDKNIIKMEV